MASLSQDDDGKSVVIRVGETMSIRLPENATTGYRWAPEKLDESLLELCSADPDYPPGAVGSGGDVTFTLRGKESGTTELVLKNWRHWEGDASITGRFRLHIKVLP